MKEVSTKKFPTIVWELIKENNISAYTFTDLDKTVKWFSFEKIIWINWDKDFYTKRFTLCHELWHNVLNHKFWDNFEEKEADNFACDLLIDEKEFKEKAEDCGWTAFDLQSYFWVPYKELQKFAKSRFWRIF